MDPFFIINKFSLDINGFDIKEFEIFFVANTFPEVKSLTISSPLLLVK